MPLVSRKPFEEFVNNFLALNSEELDCRESVIGDVLEARL